MGVIMINKVKIISIMLFLASFLILSCDNSCSAEETPKSEKVTLTSIDVTSYPTKRLYITGEVFDPTGMTVKANYSDGSSKELKSGEYVCSPSAKLTENNTKITVSYTDSGIKKETEIPIQIGYAIEIKESVNGTVKCNADRAVSKSAVTLTVTPASDEYELENLLYMYTESSGEEVVRNLGISADKTEYKFDMPSYNIIVKATFKLKSDISTYSVTLNKIGAKGNIKVTLSYDDETFTDSDLEKIPAGKEIKISAKPDAGYNLPKLPKVSYTNEAGEQNVQVTTVDLQTGDFSFIMPAANVVLKVTVRKFGTQKLSVIISGKGTAELYVNGQIISSETYLPPETEVAMIITPADGYELTSVKLNGESLEGTTFETENRDSVLEVSFSEKTGYEILTGIVDYGELRFSHTRAHEGTTVKITGVPDKGYAAIDNLTVVQNDEARTPVNAVKINDNEYSFVMPENNVTVSAVFRGHLITINKSEGGKIIAAKSAKAGEKVTLAAIGENEEKALGTIVIKTGNKNLDNNRTDKDNESEITFTMPEDDVVIDAVFGKKIEAGYSITPEKAGIAELYQGQTYITLTSKMYFAAGTEITIKTTAGKIGEEIYEVGNVKVDSVNGSAGAVVATVVENKEYKFTVPEKNINIAVEFSVTNAKRVHINDIIGGTVVAEVDGKTVTSSSESWLDSDAYVVENKSVTVRANPDTGYEIKTLTYNETPINSGDSFIMPQNEVTISAAFQKKSYTLNFDTPSNGTISLSSSFTYDNVSKKLSAAGIIYTSGAKVPYDEIVYLIAQPSNKDYIEQIKVTNEAEGADIKIERKDKITFPYQFKMPASDTGTSVKVAFEFSGSDVNLWINGTAKKSFTLNPTPDTATWPTLLKEYYIESENASGYTQMGYELKKGDKVQLKKKDGTVLNHWEGALGFDETNPNYIPAESAYIAEEDGIYKMYYKIWKESDGSEGYSQWIQIPRTAELTAADYYLCVNGKNTKTFLVSATIDRELFPTLKKEFYLKGVSLQQGDKITIDTNASTLPQDGILHWEPTNKVGAVDNEPFKVPSSKKYDFYFKIWDDGGTSIWVEESKTTTN